MLLYMYKKYMTCIHTCIEMCIDASLNAVLHSSKSIHEINLKCQVHFNVHYVIDLMMLYFKRIIPIQVLVHLHTRFDVGVMFQ